MAEAGITGRGLLPPLLPPAPSFFFFSPFFSSSSPSSSPLISMEFMGVGGLEPPLPPR